MSKGMIEEGSWQTYLKIILLVIILSLEIPQENDIKEIVR